MIPKFFNNKKYSYIASFVATSLFIQAGGDVLSIFIWVWQLDTSLVKIFKAYNVAAISKLLIWKQDSSGVQFHPVEFPLQAAL